VILAHNDSDTDLLHKTELATLESQNEALEQTLIGVTGLSEEVLVEVHRLKRKKQNTDNLLNTLTSMAQAKTLATRLDSYDENSSLDSLKKFVIELHYSLTNVPKKYFEKELHLYDQFTQRMAVVLRSKFDAAVHGKRMGEASNIVNLAKIMRLDFDLTKKFEEALLADVRAKVSAVEQTINKKSRSFGSIRNCLGADTPSLRIDFEEQSSYPDIYFHGVIDALTVLYESLASLKDSNFVMESETPFRLVLSALFDQILAEFLHRTREKMDAFFGVDLGAILSRQEEIVIVIERDSSPGKRLSLKRNEELVVLEYYLLEVMNVASQTKLFAEEVVQELLSLVALPQYQAFFAGSNWKEAETRRLVSSYAFNAEAAEMMAYYKVIQEKVWKSRLAAILSDSKSLRVLFYGSAAEIEAFIGGGAVDDSKSESSASREGTAYDYLEDIFYTLNGGLTRAVRSLDKVTSCTLLGFAGSTILCNDLFKLSKQLLQRFLELAGQDSSEGVTLSKEDLGFNRGMCTALNSVAIMLEFTQRLSEQVQDATKTQYESAGDPLDLHVILESCRSFENQTTRTFHNLLTSTIKTLVEKLLKTGIGSVLQAYHSFDFALTEKVFQEMEAFPTKWSVTARVARRLEGTLDSWRNHLKQSVYDIFCAELSKSMSDMILSVVFKKKFNSLGALFLDKEVRQLLTALQTAADQTLTKNFMRLTAATEVLMVDSKEEAFSFGRQSLSEKEITDLLKQRIASV
jgi:hypothetical protein